MITSRLNRKGRTTIPRSVRQVLSLGEHDSLEFELKDGYVILRKARQAQGKGPFAIFEEWTSEADQRAYCDL